MDDNLEKYKTSLLNFTKLNINDNVFCLIGIMFLTDLNRYCKSNSIAVHGYYFVSSLIQLIELIHQIFLNVDVEHNTNIIFIKYNIIKSLIKNIDYINNSIDLNHNSNIYKESINKNFYKILKFIDDKLIDLNNIKNNTTNEILNKLLIPYFNILFTTSFYLGNGFIKNDNSFINNVSIYMANIIYTYFILKSKINIVHETYDNYIENKKNLIKIFLEKDIYTKNIKNIIIEMDNNITILM